MPEAYTGNIEAESRANENFRKVIFTAPHSQLVLMALQPGEEIGLEVHPDNDQFLRIESGTGQAILNGQTSALADGSAVVVPAGTEHNIINTGTMAMKLYTIYSPAHHPVGTIHPTKAAADLAEKSHS